MAIMIFDLLLFVPIPKLLVAVMLLHYKCIKCVQKHTQDVLSKKNTPNRDSSTTNIVITFHSSHVIISEKIHPA
jgi:hypothetical protein